MTHPLDSASGRVEHPRVLTAAPAGLPVAVRLSLLRYLLGSRRSELVLTVLAGGGLLAGGIAFLFFSPDTVDSDRYGALDSRLLGLVCLAIALFLLFGLPIGAKRQLKDGFSAGADHTGVYLRPMLDKNRVLFIPWSGVEQIRVARWHGPQLVVKPRDTVVEGQFVLPSRGGLQNQAGIAIAQRRRLSRLGTNIHAPIPGVDRARLLSDLRYQAGGRAPVDMQ